MSRRSLYPMAVLAACLAGGTLASSIGAAATEPKRTRLLHGPLVLRLTGYEDAPVGGGRDEWRYLVLYKLSQDVVKRPEGASERWRTTRGSYSILNIDRVLENSPRKFGSSGCFALIVFGPGDVLPEGDPTAEKLDKIPVDGRVKIRLRPLERAADGRIQLGRSYVSRPRLRRADVSLNTRSARRQLKRIGCKNRPLP